jgi:ferredoxin
MKVTVDVEKCCGAGQCVMIAPEVFDQSEDDGVVQLLDPAPGEELRPVVQNAAAMCPAAAITLEG